MTDKLDTIIDTLTALNLRFELFANDTSHTLKNIEITDHKQNEMLAEHIKRSDELEKNNILLENKINDDFVLLKTSVQTSLEPLKFLSQLMKYLVLLGTLAASLTAVIFLVNSVK
jgi:hypothetical protein